MLPLGEKLEDAINSLPTFLAAAIAELLDRLEDRLGLLAAEGVVDIDDHQGRTPAELLGAAELLVHLPPQLDGGRACVGVLVPIMLIIVTLMVAAILRLVDVRKELTSRS